MKDGLQLLSPPQTHLRLLTVRQRQPDMLFTLLCFKSFIFLNLFFFVIDKTQWADFMFPVYTFSYNKWWYVETWDNNADCHIIRIKEMSLYSRKKVKRSKPTEMYTKTYIWDLN